MKTERGYDYITEFKYANVKNQIAQYQHEAATAQLADNLPKPLGLRTRLGLGIARIGLAIAARPELLDSRELTAATK